MYRKKTSSTISEFLPKSVKLLHTLQINETLNKNHIECKKDTTDISLSTNGKILASLTNDNIICLWDIENGKFISFLKFENKRFGSLSWSPDSINLALGSINENLSIWNIHHDHLFTTFESKITASSRRASWSPDGNFLAAGGTDNSLYLYNQKGKIVKVLDGYTGIVVSIAWSPNSEIIALASLVDTISIWNVVTGELIIKLKGHQGPVSTIEWSPDGKFLASGSFDYTVRLWDINTGREKRIFEGHKEMVTCVRFSSTFNLIASKSIDQEIFLWNCKSGESIAISKGLKSQENNSRESIVFHPTKPIYATLDDKNSVIRVFEFKTDLLFKESLDQHNIQYSSAKVVIVGETNTGKTCLARALMGKKFEPQESSHGIIVWNFHTKSDVNMNSNQTVREILLWDLAGQPEYQLIHQLFLDDTILGIIVFDPTHPEYPFYGVSHWEKSLRKVMGKSCKLLLVAGRVDRGYPTITENDIKEFCRQHGFYNFVVTSAKTGKGICELKEMTINSISWDLLPVTSSPELWEEIRQYLFRKRTDNIVLTRKSDLWELFKQSHQMVNYPDKEFDTIITHAQTQGLIWRLSFCDFILMKPEILNNYASTIVRFARKHPKGLGCVLERDVLEAQIDFEDLNRLSNKEEKILLHALVELFLDREIALREGDYLVFPSKFNRKRPEYPRPPRFEANYFFSGPIEEIYATLVVRLFYSKVFKMKNLWKNAAEFHDTLNAICGFILSVSAEGFGIISIFFEDSVPIISRVLFQQFIHEHLKNRALPSSVKAERIYYCPKCGEEVKDRRAIKIRLENEKLTIPCLYCDNEILLIDIIEKQLRDKKSLSHVRKIEINSRENKDQEVGLTKVRAKTDFNEFDVFLAYNSKDKNQVSIISEELKRRGINPWIDEEQIPPGRWFQDIIQETIPLVKSAAIVIGQEGLGKWQILEVRTFISQCVERHVPVIPILLPHVTELPQALIFLREFSMIRFDKNVKEVKELNKLEWGITGKYPYKQSRTLNEELKAKINL